MLDQSKIQTMTKLAIYEKNEGKEELKISKYYKTDYVRLQAVKAFVCSTIGFILMAVLIAFYQMEYLIVNVTKLDFTSIGKYILLIYIMTSSLYIVIAMASAARKYNKTKVGLIKYKSLLNELRKIYDNDDAALD